MSAKKPTEELAREWADEECPAVASEYLVSRLTALLNRVSYEAGLDATTVATELCAGEYIKARAEERKRCADIVQAARAIAAGQATSGCSDSALFLGDVLRRIEEGK